MLIKKINFFTKKRLFFLLLTIFLWGFKSERVFSYKAYPPQFNYPGTKTAALGNVTLPGISSSDVLFLNPAGISQIEKNLLSYEFETSLLFNGINFKYSIGLNFIGGIGYYFYKTSDKPLKFPFAVSYFTMMKSSRLNSLTQFKINSFTKDFSLQKIGIIKGFSLGDNVHFGINAGPVLANEKTKYTISFSAQAGVKINVSDSLFLGGYFSSPIVLNWNQGIKELLPFQSAVSVNYKITDGFYLLSEVKWEGWDYVYYKYYNHEHFINQGDNLFDLGQNIFPSISLYYKGYERTLEKNLPRNFQELHDRQIQIQSNLKILQIPPESRDLIKRLNDIQMQRREIYKRINELRYKQRSPEDEKKLELLKKTLYKRKKEIKSLMQQTNSDIIFSDQNQISNITEKIYNLGISNSNDYEAINKIRRKKLSETEKKELQNLSQQNSDIRRQIKNLRDKQEMIQQTWENQRENVWRKGERNFKKLNKKEKELYFIEKKIRELNEELKNIRSMKRKIRRGGKATILDGEFYFGFLPKVTYTPDGKYKTTGLLNLGFSFKPANLKSLYITLVLEDQSVLKLLNIFPDNDVLETIRVSTDFYF